MSAAMTPRRRADLQQLQQRGEQYRAEGLCRACGADADGYAHCWEHRRYYRTRKRERYQQRRAQGLCVQCGADAGGRALCEAHR